jgi:hypothetical protein
VTPGEEAKDMREKAQEVPRRYSDGDQSESASVSPWRFRPVRVWV